MGKNLKEYPWDEQKSRPGITSFLLSPRDNSDGQGYVMIACNDQLMMTMMAAKDRPLVTAHYFHRVFAITL